MIKKIFKQKGVVLLEVLMAATILGIILVPLLNFLVTGIESSWFASKESKAQALAREALEALRSIRERNWLELENGIFYPVVDLGVWKLVADEAGETIDSFNRQIKIEPVYRDDSDKIVEAGGRLDPSTKLATIKVAWRSLRDRSITFKTYLTRYLDNLVWIQTTKAEFDAGEMELVKTVDPSIDDGEVILKGGCVAESPEALIYDDQLQNGWRANCDGLRFFWWLICQLIQFFNGASIQLDATEYTWNGSAHSIKLNLNPPGSGSFWSWARFYNWDGVCTKGFKNIHFYAYNAGVEEVTFNFTAVHDHWDNVEIVLPSREWTEVSIDYEQAHEEYETSLNSIYFSKWMTAGDPAITVYIDQIELTGGVGGYFTQGTLSSSVFDAGRETAFNQISFEADVPAETSIGFQLATSSRADGPWLFYGPGGTTSDSDLYTNPDGEGIWLGNNLGRFCRYKAYLFSYDGVSSPTLEKVRVNYAP